VRRREFLRGAASASLIGGCAARFDSPAPLDLLRPGSWAVHRPLPSGRQEIAVVAFGERVVVIGGFGELAEPLATVEAYSPETDTWESLAPLPAALHHLAATVVDGRLLVLGGFADRVPPWRAQRAVFEYDPSRNAWTTRAPMLIARGGHAVATVAGRVHVVGGSDGDVMAAHEAYDPAGDRWTRLGDMPTARDHLAATAFQGRLWAIGGRSSFFGDQYAHVEIYDPATNAWSTGAPLPEGRGGLAAIALSDRIFVLGGESPLRIFGSNEMYEVLGDRWIGKDPMPTPRHGIGAALLAGKIWVPGGATRPGFARSAANEAFTP
jgi:N-acetylneuraminic acid mutarotase